jgi:Ser/Thr protein kinase RdoA (MazF antagonist)
MLDRIVAVVEDVVGASEAEPAVGSHRSFRPAQVLLSGDVMSFIDFDGFCQAEPAMDVAMFCSMIRAISLNKGVEDKASLATMADTTRAARLADGERLCSAFLEGYRTVRPINAARVVAWETAHIGSLVVASWTKLKLSRLPNTLYLLDDQLERNGAVLIGR